MVFRCFRRAFFSVTATSILLGQQILIKPLSVQAQNTSSTPTVKAPQWEAYSGSNKTYPDAYTACKKEYELKDAGYSSKTLKDVKFDEGDIYQGSVKSAKCLLDWGGIEYTAFVIARCPNAPDGSTYSYSGAINGVCILSSKLQANDNKKPNWCTNSLDKFTLNDQIVDFSPGCRNHDICYWIIAPEGTDTKPICDKNFYSDLKNICDQTFVNEITTPLKVSGRQKCYESAGIYYNAVSGTGITGAVAGNRAREGYDKAQQEAKDVRKSLEERFGKNGVSPEYNKDIAWELASRQATRENVDTSKINAVNSIATNIILNR